MKKSFKRTLAKGLSVVMALSVLAMAPSSESEAAKAKKPKMAKKTYSVTVGKKVTVKISSKKKVKKTTWSLSKKDKKKISLSKKKAKSVVVKGKKANQTATLKASVKVGSKTYKLSTKIKVKKATVKATAKPTAKPTNKPVATATPTQNTNNGGSTESKDLIISDKDGTKYDIDQTKTLNIPVTSLNETVMSCDDKHDLDTLSDYAHVGAEYKKGLSFITQDAFNYGAAFYLDPITAESDLEDAGEGVKEGFTTVPKEGKAQPVDIGDYDVLRIAIKSDRETNIRVWNKEAYDKIVSGEAGWPGQTAAVYNGWDSVGRGDYVGKEPVKDGSKDTANVYYKDADHSATIDDGYIVLPIKEIVKAAKQSSLVALGVCGQFKGQEITIKSIELMKVKNSVSVKTPVNVSISQADKKTKIVNGSALDFSAVVADKNEQAMADEKVEWTVEGDAATIKADETDANKATLTADETKTGKVTVIATSKTDAKVLAKYEVEICDPATTLSLGFTNEYDTYTIDEVKDGVSVTAEGLNGAGEHAANQPTDIKVEVDTAKTTAGLTYADNKVKGTVAGTIVLKASATGVDDATVTIKVVEGARISLTADNVKAFGNNAHKITDLTASADGKSVSLTTQDWNCGVAVNVALPEGKTVANVKGLIFTVASDSVTGGTDRPHKVELGVVTDGNLDTQTAVGNGIQLYTSDPKNTSNEIYKDAGYTAEATWKWADIDADVDLAATSAWFKLGAVSGAAPFKYSNIIVLTGDPDAGVKYEKNTAEVVVGDTTELTAKMVTLPSGDSVSKIEFASDKADIATVSAGTLAENANTVTVTAVKAGTAKITATMTTTKGNTAKAVATVTVKDPSVKISKVTPIILGEASYCANEKKLGCATDAKKDAVVTYAWSITKSVEGVTLENATTDSPTLAAGTTEGTVTVKVTATIDGKDYTDTVDVVIQNDKFAGKNFVYIGPVNPAGAAYNAPGWGCAGATGTELVPALGAGKTATITYKYYDAEQKDVTAKDLFQIAQVGKAPGEQLTADEIEGQLTGKLDGTGTLTYKNKTERDICLRQIVYQNCVANTGVSYFVIEKIEISE